MAGPSAISATMWTIASSRSGPTWWPRPWCRITRWGAHTASLGLASAAGNTLPPAFAEGMFVGQHGLWNRKPRSGYKVVFVPFRDGHPADMPIDVLTGFVRDNGDAMGRPVGVAIDQRGALLVADDVGNTIWRVSKAKTEYSLPAWASVSPPPAFSRSPSSRRNHPIASRYASTRTRATRR